MKDIKKFRCINPNGLIVRSDPKYLNFRVGEIYTIRISKYIINGEVYVNRKILYDSKNKKMNYVLSARELNDVFVPLREDNLEKLLNE